MFSASDSLVPGSRLRRIAAAEHETAADEVEIGVQLRLSGRPPQGESDTLRVASIMVAALNARGGTRRPSLNVSRRTLAEWRTGRKRMERTTVRLIAEILGQDPDLSEICAPD